MDQQRGIGGGALLRPTGIRGKTDSWQAENNRRMFSDKIRNWRQRLDEGSVVEIPN